MRVLAVADHPSDALWGAGVTERLRDVDLILSCGDLDPAYLSYLVTFSKAPLYYVPGNHDGRYASAPPEGCQSIDGRVVEFRGLRILGLGGSAAYNGGSPHQYTQRQMDLRVKKLWLPIHRRRGFDLLLTHSPALGLGDGTDPAHVGFEAFRDLLDRWHPAFFVHGHSHLNYSRRLKRVSYCGSTQIINAYEQYFFDIP